jgi:hypothetical protein
MATMDDQARRDAAPVMAFYMTKRGAGVVRRVRSEAELVNLFSWLFSRRINAKARVGDVVVGEVDLDMASDDGRGGWWFDKDAFRAVPGLRGGVRS